MRATGNGNAENYDVTIICRLFPPQRKYRRQHLYLIFLDIYPRDKHNHFFQCFRNVLTSPSRSFHCQLDVFSVCSLLKSPSSWPLWKQLYSPQDHLMETLHFLISQHLKSSLQIDFTFYRNVSHISTFSTFFYFNLASTDQNQTVFDGKSSSPAITPSR